MIAHNNNCIKENTPPPQISIITAAYNVERYLSVCLNSILSQTFRDFELILIDDGSTDLTGGICDYYAGKDSRIRVFHQENKGVSDTWNAGLQLAKGKYVGFVDSDDCIHPQMYEIMHSAIRMTESDIAYCGFQSIHDDCREMPFCTLVDFDIRTSSREEELRIITEPNARSNETIWKGLYKLSCIKDLRFLSGMTWQDRMWSPCAVLKANKIIRIDAPLYYYRVRAGSNSHSNSIRHYSNGLFVGCELMEHLSIDAPEWIVPFTLKLFSDTSTLYNKLAESQDEGDYTIPRERIDRALEYFSRISFQSILIESRINTRRKAIALIGKVSFPAACFTKKALLAIHDYRFRPLSESPRTTFSTTNG